jgi:hypothetical protein
MNHKLDCISTQSDDDLLMDFMDWTRAYRNEGELFGIDRKYYQKLCKEVRDRKLLSLGKATKI